MLFVPFNHCLVKALLSSLMVITLLSCTSSERDHIVEGDSVDDLNVTALSGTTSDGIVFDKRFVILNIWAPWCPPCLDEMPSLERLSRRLDPGRYRVVGVTVDDKHLAEEFLRKVDVTFDNYYDPERVVVEGKLGSEFFPETLLFAQNGVFLQRITGWQEWDSDEVVAELEKMYVEYQR